MSEPKILSLPGKALALWRWLTDPIPPLQSDESRRQLSLLASLLLAAFIAVVLLVPVPLLVNHLPPFSDPQFIATCFGAVFLFTAFQLTRRGYAQAATILALVYGTGAILTASLIIGGTSGINGLYYLLSVFVFACLFLPLRAALVVLGAQTLGILLVIFTGRMPAGEIINGPLVFDLFLGCIILIVAHHWRLEQNERLANLREEEERYRIISETVSDYAFSFWVNPDETIELDWITNSALNRVTGYTSDDVKDGGIFAFAPSEQDAVREEWRRTMQGEQTDGEHLLMTKPGDARWVHIYRQPVWDEAQKRVVRIFGVAEDVTERKKAELALRASEERYRLISETMSDYAFSFSINPDKTTRLEWVTDSISQVTGYTPDEVRAIGEQNPFGLYHPDDRAHVRADLDKLIARQSTEGEYRILTKTGETRWVDIFRRPIWDETEGRVVRFYGVAKDITERKLADAALRDNEERHRMISEMISDYAFSMHVEPDGTFVTDWVTDSVARVTGYTPEEFGLLGPYKLYHPDDEAAANADVQQVLRGDVTDSEYRIITKSGVLRWIRVYRRPIRDENENRILRFYAVAQDVTEHKQAETQKLRLALEQERLTMVSQFVQAFSHDVRTSLATIETSRYLIERLTAGVQQAQLPAQLNKIHYSVNHLAEQLNNLHMVSSLSDPNPIPSQVNRLIEGLMAEHSLRATQKKQTLVFQPDPNLAIIAADEVKLRLAVQHLLLNALAHTGEGGSITLRTRQDEHHILIEIDDTGVGIEPEKLPYVFEPFFKTDLSRKLEEGGMGLGLSIVSMIVEAHGGQISVTSQPGQGSLFTIALPLRPKSASVSLENHQPV